MRSEYPKMRKRVSSGNYSFYQLIKDIPKVEIHLHLEGLVSVDTIWKLIKENNLQLEGVDSKESLKKRFAVKSLNEFIDLFINIIQACFIKEQDINLLIEDAQKYLVRNQIVHAEIFVAVSKFIKSGFSYSHIADILDSGAKKIYKETGISVKFIIDVSRTFGAANAAKNLELVIANPRENIIGIGLGGSESRGPAEDYEETFKLAAKNKLKVVAHAGEDVGPESIWNTLNLLKAQRIGHGISAIQDEKLMDYLKEKHIPMEICPTSNLFTRKFVSEIENHPVREFFNKGLNVTLNSDDPTLFNSELTEEYILLYDNKIFTDEELFEIMKNTIFSSFLPEKEKQRIWKDAQKVIKKYKKNK